MNDETNQMNDETEEFRRFRQAQLNEQAAERTKLEKEYGKVWSTEELCNDFQVVGFMAPLVIVETAQPGKRAAWSFSTARASTSIFSQTKDEIRRPSWKYS